ncbi:MAG: 4-hydroxy-3-methylbut-2-enyl diphosphate reductase [Candidatus Zixiibacteriota bacterium]|nr:MAG: 4-hydroxy-3-methylbut-2-enyl diphosphate reductase [candidate division Zixibacteria bacterium]
MLKKIIIARHHGFCMGVKRAIKIAEETAREEIGNVTILNEIVHNEAVVEMFNRQGVNQAFSVDDVEKGTVIISAHGIAPAVIKDARAKGLKVVDATCPLVSRIYSIINKIVTNGYDVIHYGDPGHDETHGIVGQAPEHITVVSSRDELLALPQWKDRKLGFTVQTTAHLEEFAEIEKLAREKWPHIEIFNTICNATGERQNAIMDLAPRVDLVLVVGSQSSANSRRLARISAAICGRGTLIGSAQDIDEGWFTGDDGVKAVGISAGASTPDFLVEEVIDRLVQISGDAAEVILPEEATSGDQEQGAK